MTPALGVDAFPEFFSAVRGVSPFSWQTRLVEEVAAQGWPDLVDLPTGSGKTALLDIAVFLLAVDAAAGRHRAPRRTLLVVDRRVVVDQAADAAEVLRAALSDPEAPEPVRSVAQALRSLSEDGPPLVTGTLRGAIVRDESWARRPDVPAVLSSTVDQVGSRLLFRGYGISDEMRPVHAGLLGTDVLLLLDEVHLSQPFAETLRALRDRYQPVAEVALPARWQVVELSATPASSARSTFRLRPEIDLDPELSPVLHRRVVASKPTELRMVKAKGSDRAPLAEACVAGALELLDRPGVRTVAVVVNRVETARDVHARLGGLVDAKLLTGRMRPLDRDRLLHGYRDRLRTGRQPRDDGTPLVVIGTQCIEAGADFDFDGLVTECASLDALRQRFGRLDRDGRLTEAGTPGPGLVFARGPDVAAGAEDPVYGTAAAATWAWLATHDSLDFGIRHLQVPEGEELLRLLAPRPSAPLLFPAHLDAWVQTSPVPRPDPDVASWLHGLRPVSTDVSIVWRCDLTQDALADAVRDEAPQPVRAVLSACPPASGEALSVPIAAARAWLTAAPPPETPDVTPPLPPDEPWRPGDPRAARPFVRWRGDDSEVVARVSALRPGDTIVVPSAYGGVSAGSWDPTSGDPVADLGDLAQLRQRRRVVLRLVPPLWPDVGLLRPGGEADDEDEDLDDRERVWDWLEGTAAPLQDHRGEAARRLLKATRRSVLRLPVRLEASAGPSDGSMSDAGASVTWFVCSGFPPRSVTRSGDAVADADSEPATSSFTGRQVTLQAHREGVGDWAGRFARRCGLDEALACDLELAGRLHDLGKLDPRFQLQLHDGDELARARADEPLAKSATAATDVRRRQRARERSGYPSGARHELLSLALIEPATRLRERAHDWDLVLHLVTAHHGYGRPFVPVAEDLEPQVVESVVDDVEVAGRSDHRLERLDAGPPDRFWRLVRHYGWFRLAWLEALLRLADHRRSEQEQEAVDGD